MCACFSPLLSPPPHNRVEHTDLTIKCDFAFLPLSLIFDVIFGSSLFYVIFVFALFFFFFKIFLMMKPKISTSIFCVTSQKISKSIIREDTTQFKNFYQVQMQTDNNKFNDSVKRYACCIECYCRWISYLLLYCEPSDMVSCIQRMRMDRALESHSEYVLLLIPGICSF